MALDEQPVDAGHEAVRTSQPYPEGFLSAPGSAAGLPDERAVCPFFRRFADGTLSAPVAAPLEGQVCAAIGEPRPQSVNQQELVCLRAAHADCPRHQHRASAPPPAPARATPKVPLATLVALLILVLSAGLSFGFVAARGGLGMPPAPNATSTAAAVIATRAPA
ncbi:MAG: hypothetical protein WCK58_05880, partial [Chloroflexota bacterium]